MEVFSNMLVAQTARPEFCFHPKCQELQLSHVIFADDFFILSGAQLSTLEMIEQTIREFGNVSGLKPNLQKK